MAKPEPKVRLAVRKPWEFPRPSDAEIYALRAFMADTATPEQNKRAREWILFEACGLRDMSFDPDNQRASDFAEGARSVGLKIVAASKLTPKATLDPTKAGMLPKPVPKRDV
jgi:hypothetical protein